MTHQYGEDDNQKIIYLKIIPTICHLFGWRYLQNMAQLCGHFRVGNFFEALQLSFLFIHLIFGVTY